MKNRVLFLVVVLTGFTIAGQIPVEAQANGKLGPFLTNLLDEYDQNGEAAAKAAANCRFAPASAPHSARSDATSSRSQKPIALEAKSTCSGSAKSSGPPAPPAAASRRRPSWHQRRLRRRPAQPAHRQAALTQTRRPGAQRPCRPPPLRECDPREPSRPRDGLLSFC